MSVQVIDLGYKPRPWQKTIHETRKRFSIAIVHRRGGKTFGLLHELVHCSLEKPKGHYAYIGPTLAQARKVMWSQLKDVAMKIPHTEIRELDMTVTFANRSVIRCLGAAEADGIRGLGFDGVVADEFQMWDQTVLPLVIMPTLAGREGWIFLIGTPSGIDPLTMEFERAQKDPDWAAFKFNCYQTNALSEHEIAIQKKNMLPAQFSLEYECNFDAGSPGQLITGDMVEAAFKRDLSPDQYSHYARILGCDIARQGDDRSVIFRRMGPMTWQPVVFQEKDLTVTAKRICEEAKAFRADAVFIDGGGVGAGAVDICRSMGVPIIEVQFGSKASDGRYANARAEMWFRMAHWLYHGGGRLYPDPAIKMELTSPTHKTDDNGRTKLEAKEDLRKRGLPSPDLADSLAVTFYMDVEPSNTKDEASTKAKDDWSFW